jgi:hypothetical protein
LSSLYSLEIGPEHRINTEFTHFVNEHDKVMTENLAKRFVNQVVGQFQTDPLPLTIPP